MTPCIRNRVHPCVFPDTVEFDAPEGYEVTVSPSSLTLNNGQSATYEVTITNETAPIGEWRFGSLTWHEKTGAYDVYSPIAVNAALFDAPDAAIGSGETGSASFDVNFGYTGPYSAAGHGLVPATVTSDNVVQDLDREFDPDDGFSDIHQFSLSGTALFRIAMPPEATEANADLDIYVFNPDGRSGGRVDQRRDQRAGRHPRPGRRDLDRLRHGWAAPGGDSDYDMYSWAISTTPGGNLTIDSAPTEAVIGTVGTVEVSWSGATAGQWQLGAVSHHDGSGPIGMTLIEVDNR